MRKVVSIIIAIIILVMLSVGGYGYYLYQTTLKPIDPQDETIINYKIEPGTSTKRVNQQLAELGLIEHPKMADLIVRLNDWSHIQAGEYALSPSLSLEQMYEKFRVGDVLEPDMVKVTIPEGYDLEYIAAAMSHLVGLTAEDLLTEWKNTDYLKTLIDEYWFLTDDILQEGIRYPLEGYIYPITYAFLDKVYTVDELTHELLTLTESKLNPIRDLFEKSSLTPHQVIALASVIEGETQRTEEMPTVAGELVLFCSSELALASSMAFSSSATLSEIPLSAAFSCSVALVVSTAATAAFTPSTACSFSLLTLSLFRAAIGAARSLIGFIVTVTVEALPALSVTMIV